SSPNCLKVTSSIPITDSAVSRVIIATSDGTILVNDLRNICHDGVTKCPTNEYKIDRKINILPYSPDDKILIDIISKDGLLAFGIYPDCNFTSTSSNNFNTLAKSFVIS
ncbi:5103_t:CDS:1, partial [Dentiscutata erythropus]